MKKVLLTGIKPTGILHIGNYLGVIRPALIQANDYNSFFFIADYHALNQVKDPKKLSHDIYQVAAIWLACGLDPEKHVFYRQSDISEISELTVILSNVASKGLLNRSHAYKAIVQENLENQNDPDKGISMGLFNYPLLMSADILMFRAQVVPVGKDQVQHVEITRNIAEAFNRTYGDILALPEAKVNKEAETIIGFDGRKMSKSYNNLIPLFGAEKEIKKAVMKMVTNSQSVEEPKDPDHCNVFSLYANFTNSVEQESLRKKYLKGGMSWGEAKAILLEKIIQYFFQFKEKFDQIKNDRVYLDRVLNDGAEKAREIARKNLGIIKKETGIK